MRQSVKNKKKLWPLVIINSVHSAYDVNRTEIGIEVDWVNCANLVKLNRNYFSQPNIRWVVSVRTVKTTTHGMTWRLGVIVTPKITAVTPCDVTAQPPRCNIRRCSRAILSAALWIAVVRPGDRRDYLHNASALCWLATARCHASSRCNCSSSHLPWRPGHIARAALAPAACVSHYWSQIILDCSDPRAMDDAVINTRITTGNLLTQSLNVYNCGVLHGPI